MELLSACAILVSFHSRLNARFWDRLITPLWRRGSQRRICTACKRGSLLCKLRSQRLSLREASLQREARLGCVVRGVPTQSVEARRKAQWQCHCGTDFLRDIINSKLVLEYLPPTSGQLMRYMLQLSSIDHDHIHTYTCACGPGWRGRYC